jgi:L-ascorbate metabolism protein UlaG (beta-lactamase superfamily)
MRLRLIGHMTTWIELDGQRLLTDPWFGPRGWLERCLAPRTVPPARLPAEIGPLDALLISHNHLDHVDDLGLALARRLDCTVIASHKAARRAEKAGLQKVVSLSEGERTSLGALTIRAVYASHPLAADAIGFVVQGSQTCYFSGDTRFGPALVAALEPFPLDVALVQAACAHYPLLGDDGMSLVEAAQFAMAVGPRWLVPLHLHCAGKWLDRAAGLRIQMDNASQVETEIRRWALSLQEQGQGVKLLSLDEVWETGI